LEGRRKPFAFPVPWQVSALGKDPTKPRRFNPVLFICQARMASFIFRVQLAADFA
jgi:hypothetical protein